MRHAEQELQVGSGRNMLGRNYAMLVNDGSFCVVVSSFSAWL